MKTRDQILQDNRLTDYLPRKGIKLKGVGAEVLATKCPVQQHKPDHWCVSINVEKQIFRCHDCKIGGSIIDWISMETGKTVGAVLNELGGCPQNSPVTTKPQMVCAYDYTDETGNLVYQVCRYEPKNFLQRQPDNNGGWIWSMEGVTRVLYHLPDVLRSKTVLICEGEKDADTLTALGFCGTCNVGGAGKWLDAYNECLAGKDIIICPDNDKAGQEHANLVHESVRQKANSVKRLTIPLHKDVTDWVSTFSDNPLAKSALDKLIADTAYSLKPAPLFTVQEMEARYRAFVQQLNQNTLSLGKFLPSLNGTGDLYPGEVALILADTGVGKSVLAQSIARCAKPLPTLFFELELPLEMMFERFVMMEMPCDARMVREEYQQNNTPIGSQYKGLQHIIVCPESGLSTAQIEEYIIKSQLRFGKPPVVVIVDYIGLIACPGSRSRYEALSQAAEQLKVIAKRTKTIMVVASQIARPEKKRESISVRLHDAKDSGSLENSAGLVIGAWRPEPSRLILKVLKNSKGPSGQEIECEFNGSIMRIKEKLS